MVDTLSSMVYGWHRLWVHWLAWSISALPLSIANLELRLACWSCVCTIDVCLSYGWPVDCCVSTIDVRLSEGWPVDCCVSTIDVCLSEGWPVDCCVSTIDVCLSEGWPVDRVSVPLMFAGVKAGLLIVCQYHWCLLELRQACWSCSVPLMFWCFFQLPVQQKCSRWLQGQCPSNFSGLVQTSSTVGGLVYNKQYCSVVWYTASSTVRWFGTQIAQFSGLVHSKQHSSVVWYTASSTVQWFGTQQAAQFGCLVHSKQHSSVVWYTASSTIQWFGTQAAQFSGLVHKQYSPVGWYTNSTVQWVGTQTVQSSGLVHKQYSPVGWYTNSTVQWVGTQTVQSSGLVHSKQHHSHHKLLSCFLSSGAILHHVC